jgi:hypothetical protein
LQEIGWAGRGIVHGDGGETADIDAHFHRRRAAQHIDSASLETALEILKPLAILLGRMLNDSKIRDIADDAVRQLRPDCARSRGLHVRVRLQPSLDLV